MLPISDLGIFFSLIFFSISTLVLGLNDNIYGATSLVNKTESLVRVQSVVLKYYEFIYDKNPGRKQIGILGSDAQKWFPESVDIVPNYSFPNRNRSKPSITISNFPIIDKNVIFMHGIAALQELIQYYDLLVDRVNRAYDKNKEFEKLVESFKNSISDEIDLRIVERSRLAQAELDFATKEVELVNLRMQEERLSIDRKLQETKRLLDYEEELSKQRLMQEEILIRENMAQKIEMEQKLAEQKEVLRRETQESIQLKKLEFNKDFELQKIEIEKDLITAELEAKARLERDNEDITLRRMKLQASLETERFVKVVKSISLQLSRIMFDLVSRPERVLYLFSGILGLILVYYVLKELFLSIKSFLQYQLGRPSLVRETSYEWRFTAWVLGLFSFLNFSSSPPSKKSLESVEQHFSSVVLSKEDKDRIISIALSTKNTKRSGAPYRHILLYGPPGTGKTLIARCLAKSSAMDYAIMSGGDVGPLGSDAVNQLHGLFKWASNSRRGLVIFIDEAEAFLSSRAFKTSSASSSDDTHMRHALNALLYHTGTQSTKFALVLATNRPEDLDSAILDRMDISMQVGLPGLEQRLSMVETYFESNVMEHARKADERSRLGQLFAWLFKANTKYVIDAECKSVLSEMANKLNGFSGREISKFFIAVQYAMTLAENRTLTKKIFWGTFLENLKEHEQKLTFFDYSDNARRK